MFVICFRFVVGVALVEGAIESWRLPVCVYMYCMVKHIQVHTCSMCGVSRCVV